MEKVVVIVGTNASGKSSLAIQLAKEFNGEVISADSRQVYTGLDIATGKVTPREMDGIAHHMIDVVEPTKRYTAADFARDGRRALFDILSHGKLPIVAGGTGFYVQALLEPDTLANVPPNHELRETLEARTAEDLFAELTHIDPQRAAMLTKRNEERNTRRLVRALEVAHTNHTDTPPRNEMAEQPHHPALDVLWLGIHWDKDKLEERIKERTKDRIENGMIEEAARLHHEGVSYERMEELGLEYKHLADYLRNRITQEELFENIVVGDRQYAKRQRTWFKRNPNIIWLTPNNLHEASQRVKEFLAT